jgi:hypothetical protein
LAQPRTSIIGTVAIVCSLAIEQKRGGRLVTFRDLVAAFAVPKAAGRRDTT